MENPSLLHVTKEKNVKMCHVPGGGGGETYINRIEQKSVKHDDSAN